MLGTALLSCLLIASFQSQAVHYDFIPGSDQTLTGRLLSAIGQTYVLGCHTNRYVFYSSTPFPVRPGDRVAVHQRLSLHPLGPPSRIALDMTVLEHGQPVPVPTMSLGEMIRGKHFLTPLRLRASVDDVTPDEADSDYVQVTLRADNHTVIMPIKRGSNDGTARLASLLYSEVEVTGVCFPFLPTVRFFKGSVFLPLNESSVRIINSNTAEVFDSPALTDLSPMSPSELSSLGLRTLTGTVLAAWNGRSVLIQSASLKELDFLNCHRIELAEGVSLPRPGTSVKVVGRPATDLFHANLISALWRPSDEVVMKPLPVLDTDIGEIIVGTGSESYYHVYRYFGRLVRIKGCILSLPQTGTDGERLYLTDLGKNFALDTSGCPDVMKRLQTGSLVSATGICLFESDNWRPNAPLPSVYGVTIILRSPQDLTILSSPSWWTTERLTAVIVGLFALLVLILVWNRVLNHLIIRRNRQLLREQSARNASELRIGERTRLAVELHDTLSQNLAGIACQVTSAQNAIGSDDGKVRQRLTSAEYILKSCRTELRQVLSDLRSDALEQDTMNAALGMVLADVAATANVSVRFAVPRQRLLDSTAHALLCIVRELVGNAIRHGRATAIKVAGALERNRLLFSVRDNGTGFDPSTSPGPAQGHFGLDGIRNRINRLGGTCRLETAPGKGTYVSFDIPLPGQGEKASKS